MAGHVAAIDGGDVERWQRLEGSGVVPIIEMAAVTLHFIQRREGAAGSADEVRGGDKSKIVSGQVRQKRHTDVGGRGAMGRSLGRIFLEIVWRQIVIDGADEGFEESPGSAGDFGQE